MPVQYQRNKQRLLGREATSRQTNKHTEECANTSKCSRVTGKPVTRHMSNGGHRDRPRSFACNRNRKRETSENHRIMWKPRAPSGLAVCPALSLVARSPPGLAETQHHNVGRHASSISGRCGVVLYLPQISLQSREDRSLTCCPKSRNYCAASQTTPCCRAPSRRQRPPGEYSLGCQAAPTLASPAPGHDSLINQRAVATGRAAPAA